MKRKIIGISTSVSPAVRLPRTLEADARSGRLGEFCSVVCDAGEGRGIGIFFKTGKYRRKHGIQTSRVSKLERSA